MDDSNLSHQVIEDSNLDDDKTSEKPQYVSDWGNGLPHLVIEKIAKFGFWTKPSKVMDHKGHNVQPMDHSSKLYIRI